MSAREDIERLLGAMLDGFDEASCVQVAEDVVPLLTAYHQIDHRSCGRWSRSFRDVASEVMSEVASTDPVKVVAMAGLIEDLLRLNCRTDFDSYMLFMEWGRDPDRRFYQPRRRVLSQIVSDLQDLYDGEIDFLNVALPPRVGKSTLCIFFLTFVMGNDPNVCNLMVGYSDALAITFYEEVMSIVSDESEYRFHEVFPEAPFVGKSAENKQIDLGREGRYKSLTCAGVTASLTGRVEVGPGGLLYCDDLVRERMEAVNPTRMANLYAAYLNQVKDRTLPGAKFLMVGTRWVPNDPAGMVKAQYEGNPRYRFSTLPALDEDGNSNFMYERSGTAVPFTREYYEDMRESLVRVGEEDSWSAKYMCSPFWREGRLFEADLLRTYEALPDGEPDAVLAVADTKTKGPDYCVQVIALKYGDDYYVHDVVCSDSVQSRINESLARRLVANRADVVRYESNVAGASVASEVESLCRSMGWPIDIERKYSTANKETRIEVDSGWVVERCLFRCDDSRGAEYDRFMNFLTSYSAKAKNEHDDVPDAMSMLKRLATSVARATAVVFDRPW